MSDLNPYYERAQSVCGLGSFSCAADGWIDGHVQPWEGPNDALYTKIFQCGSNKIFTHYYKDLLRRSGTITVYLNAIAVELETDNVGRSVNCVRALTLEGNRFCVFSKYVVIAAGALETTRLLMLSNAFYSLGLGNQAGLLGRFLMDHQMVRSGLLKPFSRNLFDQMSLCDLRPVRGTQVIGKFVIKEEIQRRHQLLNTATALFPRNAFVAWNPIRTLFPEGKNYRSDAFKSLFLLRECMQKGSWPTTLSKHLANVVMGLDDILYDIWRGRNPLHHPFESYNFDHGGWSALPRKHKSFAYFDVFHLVEQAPDPSNCLVLGTDRDVLGCRRINVFWRWQERDIDSMIKTQDLLVNEFARMGLGRLKLERDKGYPQLIYAGLHHPMGTTRMSLDPRGGVVDANCKVHEISNLYIASSSVFPTGGYANPTLTIVALAIRIADHLKACEG